MRARRRAGRTLAAAAMLLSAAAGESTSASTVVVLYSDANCASTPTKISFQANASCSAADAVDCSSEVSTNPDAQTYYYYTKECAEDYVEFAEETFGSDAFLLLNYYNTSGCDDWYAAILYPLDGKCHATDVYGTSGAIADMADNGTVTIDWYDDSTCRGSSNNSFVVEGDAVANEECVKDVYTFVVYNTDGESSSGSSETPTSSAKYGNESDESASAASSTTTVTSGSDGNSKLGAGSIVGIIIAAIIVVALAVASVFYYRRKSSDVKIKRQGSVQLLEDVSQKLHRTPTVSKQSRRSNTVSTQRHHSTQGDLWDDEVIIAARIPREKVLVGDLISRGGYGEVYLGSYNSQQVAVKMLLPETKRKMRYVNDFLAEIKMVAILEHSCIVQFVGVAWDSLMDLCVVCEYMEGGDLRSLLESFEETHHPQGFDYEKVKIAKQVVHALTYLHSLQPMVLHRDLKSRNVLLNNVMDAKLTDFGVSRERQDRTMTAGVGTSLWMAPEVMMGGRYDDKADMFSFGVLLTELDSHLLPYSNTRDPMRSSRKLPDTAILQMVVAGNLTVTFSPNCLKSIVQLGTECVSMNPEDRPTAAQALGRLHTISVQEVEQSPGVMFSI